VGAIAFEPEPPALSRTLALARMGQVVKMVLQFDEPFWLDPRFGKRMGHATIDEMAFLHSRVRLPFPLWWTSYPTRAPVLVAWAAIACRHGCRATCRPRSGSPAKVPIVKAGRGRCTARSRRAGARRTRS
jgi:hypothetical protein